MTPNRAAPAVPILFLVADTGGGHRSAARAVTEALADAYPGRIVAIWCDPLGGAASSRLLRWVTGLYGPAIRRAPRIWGAIYRATDSPSAMHVVRRTLLALAERPTVAAVARHKPAAVVSFHPLLCATAVTAARRASHPGPAPPVVTVVTDLVTTHVAWRYPDVDRVVAPSAAVRWRYHLDGMESRRCVEIGLPVGGAFEGGPPLPAERAALRRCLGVSERRFLVVMAGGGEGTGGIARRAAAIVRRLPDVDVVVICGRNRRLRARLARRAGPRLRVHGFVDNMADWLRAADIVVTKAGPGMIAEATCVGAPLVLVSHLPGQEDGNVELVVGAGAGCHAPSVARLVRQLDRLHRDPAALDAMRAASARLGRPDAAGGIAALLADMVGVETPAQLAAAADG